jgi:group I intron endonuclease
MSIGIYKITSPTKKIYIGQSINIEKRQSQYRNLNKKGIGNYIYNSLKKYGYENHKFEIIEECSIEQLNEKEIYWINFFDCVKYGLNLKEGGTKGKHTFKTKNIIRLKATGRKLSNEAKEKISQSKIGNKYSLGKKRTEETKQKMSISYKGEYTKERGNKIKLKIQKPIIQYDMKMNIIKEWSSQTEASNKLNIKQAGISSCLNNKTKSSGGYKWIFKN